MIDTFQNIKIHNVHYNVNELMVLCKEKIINSQVQNWEKEIYLFLQDWYSPSNTIVVFTSGSTGSPKKIMLQKKYMIVSAKATLLFFDLKKDDTALLCLPVKYIAGKMMIVRSIVGGLNLLYSKPDSLPYIVMDQKVNFAAMVPNQVFGLLNSKAGIQQLLNIDNLLIGGASISDKLKKMLLANPAITAWQSYGMTETITHIALRRIRHNNNANRYYPLKGIVVHTNNNNQLIINAQKLGVTNLVTNDIAKVFEDGSFFINGRVDNVIVSGGVKLFPEIVERKIKKIVPGCFFIGSIPDERLGEKLILFIEGSLIKESRVDLLKNELKNNLQKFEVPKEIVFLPKFLRTETGKIIRKEIIHIFLRR